MAKNYEKACEYLEYENNALKNAMKWISVEEKLPEKAAPVLTWGSHKIPTVCFRTVDEDWVWVEEGDVTFDYLLGITHWMPLPSPPCLCPACCSSDIDLTWLTPTNVPEYQCGVCNDCGEVWNECARQQKIQVLHGYAQKPAQVQSEQFCA